MSETDMKQNDIENEAEAAVAAAEASEDAYSENQVNASAPGKRSTFARVMAVIGLLIMLGLIVWLVISLITGSEQTIAVLFLTILYPVIIYLFIWIKKVFSR